MRFRKIIKLFEDSNVCVCGLRGRGKDLLMANVIVRRKLPYISNIDYGGSHYEFDYNSLNCGENTYNDFLMKTVKHYEFPFPDQTDVYLSDAGIYFPAQYCNELNKRFQYMSVFQAISRHVGDCNFHFNSQNLNRVWDKIREQSDIYVLCRRCFYLKGLVIQFVTLYDQYDSAVKRMKPLKLPSPLFGNRESRMMRSVTIAQHEATHGMIKNGVLIYRNKSNYNTRQFKEILKGGAKIE